MNKHDTYVLKQDWQTFSIKGQRINIFIFAGYMVRVATTQLYCYSTKAARDNPLKE